MFCDVYFTGCLANLCVKPQAADMAMITHGWTWTQSSWSIEQQQDKPAPPLLEASSSGGGSPSPVSDGQGWTYATNFGSIEESGSAVKGMVHFVRRRRRSRQQTFVGGWPSEPSLCACAVCSELF